MDFLADLTIGGIALAPVVVGIVTLAKQFGFPADKAVYLNGALSVAAYLAVVYLQAHPELMEAAKVVATGVVIFLTSSGVYQLGLGKTNK